MREFINRFLEWRIAMWGYCGCRPHTRAKRRRLPLNRAIDRRLLALNSRIKSVLLSFLERWVIKWIVVSVRTLLTNPHKLVASAPIEFISFAFEHPKRIPALLFALVHLILLFNVESTGPRLVLCFAEIVGIALLWAWGRLHRNDHLLQCVVSRDGLVPFLQLVHDFTREFVYWFWDLRSVRFRLIENHVLTVELHTIPKHPMRYIHIKSTIDPFRILCLLQTWDVLCADWFAEEVTLIHH